MNITKDEIREFLEESIEWLIDQDMGCSTLKIDDRLAVCVGWLKGYDPDDKTVIHSKEQPEWGLNAGIKVWTSDDLLDEYEFINAPYYEDGEVVDTDVSISPDRDLDDLVDWLYDAYAGLATLDIEEDGKINNEKPEHDSFADDFEDMEEACADESLKKEKEVKESYEGESVIDDLIERAQSIYDEGGYSDVSDCVAQAIDDGLIYTEDIHALAEHYGTMPEDSDLIADFYDELFNDVYSGVEEHAEPEEDEDDDWYSEDETDEALAPKESKKSREHKRVERPLKEESSIVAKVKEAIEIIKKIDNEAFYPALLIYDILGDVDVTEDLVRKVESIESDYDTVYDDFMRDEIRSAYNDEE